MFRLFQATRPASRVPGSWKKPRLEALENRTLLSAGDLDPTFGTGGLVQTDINSTSNVATDLVIQPDGKILAAGYARNSSTLNDFALVRYNSNGTRDTSFGNNGVVLTDMNKRQDSIEAVALQADGKIVAAGVSWIRKPFGDFDPHLALARYLPNGTLDKTFGNKGTVRTDLGSRLNDGIRSLAIQSDGKIVAAGVTSAFAGGDNFLLARYTSTGNLDSTFGNGGIVVTDFGGGEGLQDLVIQSDGKFVVAGSTITNQGRSMIALARYNANGSLDTTFGTGGKVTTLVGTVSSAAIDVDVRPDGRLLVAGNFEYLTSTGGSRLELAMVRYLADGSLDSSFDGDGMAAFIDVMPGAFGASEMAVQPNGKILVAGTQRGSYERNFGVVRLDPDGSLDLTFGGVGWVTTDFNDSVSDDWHFASAISLQGDGKIVVAGGSNDQAVADFALARYEGDPPAAPAAAGPGSAWTASELEFILASLVLEQPTKRRE